MPKYNFEVEVSGTEYWTIEADNEEEARKRLFREGEMTLSETDEVLDIYLVDEED